MIQLIQHGKSSGVRSYQAWPAIRSGLSLCVLAMCFSNAVAQIQFNDVSASAGITFTGESYGAAWGDVNNDGYPDLFTNHHRMESQLLVNQGNGVFVDQPVSVFQNRVNADTHGGVWGDFDNDGDQDLFVSTGFQNPSQFLRNNNGNLVDQTGQFGFEFTDREGRMPIWHDYDRDGRLDFVLSGAPSSLLMHQAANGTFSAPSGTGFSCGRTHYGQLSDFTMDGVLDYICSETTYPLRIFDQSQLPFQDRTSLLASLGSIGDAATADFNGDTRPDVFRIRGSNRPSGIGKDGSNKVEAALSQGHKGVAFTTTGTLSFDVDWKRFGGGMKIFVGSSGWVPNGFSFTLNPANANTHGLKNYNPATEPGIYIGYNVNNNEWTIMQASANLNFTNSYFLISSTAAVSGLRKINFAYGDQPINPNMQFNLAGGFENRTSFSQLATPMECGGVAAGDFDNDMDVDLYITCRTAVENIENRLYENNGSGVFTRVPNAGGAEGPLGAAVGSGAGTADNVVIADFDIDGALDLFVTNGSNLRPIRIGGPDKLYKNVGNTNNWILLDLVGVSSNRDAIGAKVFATAGGVVQLREQNGGYHRWSQNHQRIHFGLAGNTQVDLRIEWPNGAVDIYTGIAANALYRATENIDIVEIQGGGDPPGTGSSCGQPNYNPGTESRIFLWQDCATRLWHMRMPGGGSFHTYSGSVISDNNFTSVVPYSLETGDVVDFTSDPSQIIYSLSAGNNYEDGFDFSFPVGSNVCFDVNQSVANPIIVGAGRTPVTAPFDLETLGSCDPGGPTNPSLSISDVSVAEDGGTASFIVTLSPASTEEVTVNYTTVDGSATAGPDYDFASGVLTFQSGTTSLPIEISINDDVDTEGNEIFTVDLSNPVNAQLADSSGTGTIVDNEVSSTCGEPTIDLSQDRAAFLWSDCSTGMWSVRFTAGGLYTRYQGTVDSDLGFSSVTPVSVESNDILTSDASQIIYDLQMGQIYQDGFDFSVPGGANLCFGVSMPAGIDVLVGPNRTPVTPPFNPETLGPCSAGVPSLSIDDVSVAEDGLTATFTVSLSSPSAGAVTVDYGTMDGTATVAGSDYVATNGQLSFTPPETSKNINVSINDDTVTEGNETFMVELSNAVGAPLADAVGIGTIIDNEVSACGEPTINLAQDRAAFLWSDCSTGEWFARFTAGGIFTIYQGTVQ